MFGEYVSSLFEGRLILLMIFSVLFGFFIGFSGARLFGSVVWVALAFLVEFIIWGSSSYIQALFRISETGSAPSGMIDGIITLSLLTYASVTVVFLLIGKVGAAEIESDNRAKATAMSPADIVSQLDIVAAHPQIGGAGWFVTKWQPMSIEERQAWSTMHVSTLRELWLETPDAGFIGSGLKLPMKLAAIYQQR